MHDIPYANRPRADGRGIDASAGQADWPPPNWRRACAACGLASGPPGSATNVVNIACCILLKFAVSLIANFLKSCYKISRQFLVHQTLSGPELISSQSLI